MKYMSSHFLIFRSWILMIGLCYSAFWSSKNLNSHLKIRWYCIMQDRCWSGRSLKKNTSVKPREQPFNLEEIRDGFIQKETWGIVYKVHEDHTVKNYMFFPNNHNTKIEIFKIRTLYKFYWIINSQIFNTEPSWWC